MPVDLAGHLLDGRQSPVQMLDGLYARSAVQSDLAETLCQMEGLAADIDANGLVMPLTVYETQAGQGLTQYTIEAGVRRWWAHWMLVRQGKGEFRHLLCLVVPARLTAARWLGENLRRQALSPVETGLALARLILESEGVDAGPAAAGELVPRPMRELARRVSDTKTWPAAAERLGYSPVQWKPYLTLLSLCDEALQLAHHYRLPADCLGEITQLEEPTQQLQALQRLLGQAGETAPVTDP